MEVKITVPKQVRDYWLQYGTIEEVVNKLLLETDWMDVPRTYCEQIDMCKMYIEVTNDDYLQMREIFSAKDNRISLSRMLIHYYDMDYAATAGWNKVHCKFRQIYILCNKMLYEETLTEEELNRVKEIQNLCITT